LLPQVVPIAIKAGTAIMQVYKQPLGPVTSKPDNSPLTEADLVSHQIICAGLAELLPHFPTLSEEAANIPSKSAAIGHSSGWLTRSTAPKNSSNVTANLPSTLPSLIMQSPSLVWSMRLSLVSVTMPRAAWGLLYSED